MLNSAHRKRQRTSTSPKDFSCSLCRGKSFKRKANLLQHWKVMHPQRYQSNNRCPYEGCGRTRFDTPDALPVHCWHVHGLSVYDISTPGCLEPGCEELRFESLTRLWEHMDTVHRAPIEPEFEFGPPPRGHHDPGPGPGRDDDDEGVQEMPRFYRGAFYQPLPLGLTPINTRPRLNKRHRPEEEEEEEVGFPGPLSTLGKDKEELYDYD